MHQENAIKAFQPIKACRCLHIYCCYLHFVLYQRKTFRVENIHISIVGYGNTRCGVKGRPTICIAFATSMSNNRHRHLRLLWNVFSIWYFLKQIYIRDSSLYIILPKWISDGHMAFPSPTNDLIQLKYITLTDVEMPCFIYHYSTLGLILPWRVTRDVLRTRPS